jgi:hypothetical protein
LARELAIEIDVGIARDRGDDRSVASLAESVDPGDGVLPALVVERSVELGHSVARDAVRVEIGFEDRVRGARIDGIGAEQEKALLRALRLLGHDRVAVAARDLGNNGRERA